MPGNDCRKSASEKLGSSSPIPGTCGTTREAFRMMLPCCSVTPLRRRCALPTILFPVECTISFAFFRRKHRNGSAAASVFVTAVLEFIASNSLRN